jgi:hypothetical protein
MQKVPVSLWTLLAGMLIAAISLWISHNHTLLPVAASQQAPLVDRFFNIMFTIAIALFIKMNGRAAFSYLAECLLLHRINYAEVLLVSSPR